MNEKCEMSCRCKGSSSAGHDRGRRLFGAQFLAIFAAAKGLSWLGAAPAAAAKNDRKAPPQAGDLLVHAQKSRRGEPFRPSDLDVAGRQIVAVPMDPASGIVRDGLRFNRVMLTRFEPGVLDEETRQRAGEGVVAYSSVCTHDACVVSSWDKANERYMCPCHGSAFDPKTGGSILEGPAYRPLPALPLTVKDGFLVVAGGFTARVGGGRMG